MSLTKNGTENSKLLPVRPGGIVNMTLSEAEMLQLKETACSLNHMSTRQQQHMALPYIVSKVYNVCYIVHSVIIYVGEDIAIFFNSLTQNCICWCINYLRGNAKLHLQLLSNSSSLLLYFLNDEESKKL